MAALTLVICCPVAAATNSTTLTTTVPVTFPLKLELSGSGTVAINGVAYTQSATVEITRNSTVEVQITQDAKNVLKSVVYNGHDYTKEAEKGKIVLPVITGKTTLCVNFTEIISSPTTGDPYSPLSFVLTLLLSLMGIIAASTCMKRETT